MLTTFAQWANALAAASYGAIAIWQLRRDDRSSTSIALVTAFALTALATLVAAMHGSAHSLVASVVHVRDLGWLFFIFAIWRQGDGRDHWGTIGWLYVTVAAVMLASTGLVFAGTDRPNAPHAEEAVFLTTTLLRMTGLTGALVLLHNLYTAATSTARDMLRLPLVGLGVLWVYDLNLYTAAYLGRSWPDDLMALRGVTSVAVMPLFALSTTRNTNWSLRLSRSMTFQSVSLFAIGAYLTLMVIVTSALQMIAGEAARAAQIAFVFGASLAALILMPSPRFRAWFRVKIAKHFFQHRYDYRVEWLRFTQTLGDAGGESQPLAMRAIKAIADITESPGGMLVAPDASGGLIVQSRWCWTGFDPGGTAAPPSLARYLAETGRIIEMDPQRADNGDSAEARLIPEWMLADHRLWAMVPLVHGGTLAGVVLLLRPMLDRTLDWEDFDLLRVAGPQVASHLAEARGQEALSDAKRFDEFNRRFAFIMHDIKNLVSQLSLVTRNAERHADNPEFRADMIETLKSSTARMNALLARLSQHNKGRPEEPAPMLLVRTAERVAAARRVQHPIVITGEHELRAMADPVRLEHALGHLVQNAIDASPDNEPVTIHLASSADGATIEVIDLGAGMSAAFISDKLFKPFVSTKEAGFGIGTYEARAIIGEMGGRIDVASREGTGSHFTITLPRVAAATETKSFEPKAKAA